MLPLAGVTVLEIGERYGAGLCGSFLMQLGADVGFLEGEEAARATGKWPHRRILAPGKQRVALVPGDETVARLAAGADVVVVSSDMDGPARRRIATARGAAAILCDITAFGAGAPNAVTGCSDAMVQALSGMMDVTGMPDGGPAVSTLLLLESSAGLYATAGILAALRVRSTSGQSQVVETAMYDCAVNFLTTFLPAHYGGTPPTRLGNGHSMVVPWNCYDTADGRVQICSVTDRQWQQLCNAIARADLAADASLTKLAGRVTQRQRVDDAIRSWARKRRTTDCVRILNAANIACGQVMRVADLADDPNLAHRSMIRSIQDDDHPVRLPASPIKARQWSGRTPTTSDETGVHLTAMAGEPRPVAIAPRKHTPATPSPPLAGVRVIEIGQFTTAPLAGKALASLGAEVIKIEPPGGDAARQWSPHRHGLSYFFVLSNSDKRSIELDLASEDGRRDFCNLIGTSDVLLENMKAGSLARLGFPPEELATLNPDLIYCPISGFGHEGVYAGRPAFDTVVQAMSGLMDMTHVDGIPIKCGPSICDVSGGQVALVACLAALLWRQRTGSATTFDLSMQDIGAYLTQTGWNGDVKPFGQTLRCSDGYVYVETLDDVADTAATCCEDVVQTLRDRGLGAARVQSISEVAVSEQTRRRDLLIASAPVDGRTWPLLNSPIRLSLTPTRVERAIGTPEKMTDALRERLRIPRGNIDAG